MLKMNTDEKQKSKLRIMNQKQSLRNLASILPPNRLLLPRPIGAQSYVFIVFKMTAQSPQTQQRRQKMSVCSVRQF